MKKFKTPLKWGKYILFTLLLALICVGTVELLVCSYQSPELYDRITAPVRAGIEQISRAGQQLWAQMSQSASDTAATAAVHLRDAWDSLTAEPEPDPEDPGELQLVDNEAVAPPPRAQASFTITSLVERDGQEYLTGGAREVTYYNQTAPRWTDEPYGSDRLGGYGCGPTAMAMVVSTLTSAPVDPAEMARRCVDSGYWARQHGSYRSIVQGVAEEYGLECASLSPEDKEGIVQYLAAGHLVVALMGPGHFTNSGHFILLRGVTLDGSILVADPASQERSLTTWELELILDELSASRDAGGPLWVISPSFS